MKIVQVLDYFTTGNAVANCAVMYYKMTLRLGIESVVAARLSDKRKPFVKEISYLEHLKEDDIVMYHMCIGTPLNKKICHYPCKKVLVYHNITPPAMLTPYEPSIAAACEEGLEQLLYMRDYFSVCLAMSEYNKQDLIRYGYRKELITVMPPYSIAKSQYQKEPDIKAMQKYGDGWVNIVFVGRISPNKRQEELIRIFKYYKIHVQAQSRLILAGHGEGSYYDRLRKYTENIEVKDVIFTNQIPFSELLAIYRTATVFLCASGHEGFCIPIIEAMYFDIPVIAYDAGAIKDTMGGAGILLKDKNPALAAKIIREICTDSALRQRLIERQRITVQQFGQDAVFQKYKQWAGALPKLFRMAGTKGNTKADETHHPYDVVMVIKAADWELAKRNIKYIKKNLRPKHVIVVAPSQIGKFIRPDGAVRFIDEDQMYEGLTLENVKKLLVQRQTGSSSAGWYFQQFLKLAYAYLCKDEYYLVWDADTIPLKKISMLDRKTGKPYFDMKPEYVSAYFTSIHNLTGMEKVEKESFIAEHMLFCTKIVKQMLSHIEKNSYINGLQFFEKIVYTLAAGQERAFSEFELYGTYCHYVYPGLYLKRHLHTMRCGQMFLGPQPGREVLQWAAKDMHTVSFEHTQKVIPESKRLSASEKFRNKHSISDLMQRVYLSDCLTCREWVRTEREALRMDAPWARHAAYMQSQDFRMKRKEQRANGHVKILIFGGSENAYFCGLMFARKGMQVWLVDEAYHKTNDKEKLTHFHTYWGFHAFFANVYEDTLHIANKIPHAMRADYILLSSSQSKRYTPYLADFDHTWTGMLLERHTEEQHLENLKHINVSAWINTALWKKDALLSGRNESVTELWEEWEDGTACHKAAALFAGQMRVKIFEDKDDFFKHVQMQADYLTKLQILQDKYGVTI